MKQVGLKFKHRMTDINNEEAQNFHKIIGFAMMACTFIAGGCITLGRYPPGGFVQVGDVRKVLQYGPMNISDYTVLTQWNMQGLYSSLNKVWRNFYIVLTTVSFGRPYGCLNLNTPRPI